MSLDIAPMVAEIPLGAVDASVPFEQPVFMRSTYTRILEVNLVDVATKTGNAANYGTYQLINKGTTGTGTTVVASRSSDTVTTDDFTPYVAWPLTLNATESNLEIAPDSVLHFLATESNPTSGDLTKALLVIEYAIGYGGGI